MAPMRCRSPTNFMRWQHRSVQFEAPQFLSWKIPSSDQQRDTTGRNDDWDVARPSGNNVVGGCPVIGAIGRDAADPGVHLIEQRATCEESPISFSIKLDAMTIAVSASAARCNFSLGAPCSQQCFSCRHSLLP